LEARNAPTNGEKTPNPKGFYEFEDEIFFTCDPGYDLIGEESTVCQPDGTWSNPAPVCEGIALHDIVTVSRVAQK